MPPARPPDRSRPDPWLVAALAMGAALAIAAWTMAWARFQACGNDNFDLGFYVRVVWGMANGDRVNSIVGAHDLGLHMMPAMVLFVPLSWLFPIPATLLAAQAIAIGGVAPLLFRLGRRVTGMGWAGLALAAAWCLHPSVLQAGCREFHPGSLALPALVAALDALHARRNITGAALLLVATMAREDVALVASAAGLAVALDADRRWAGLGLAAAGLAWFLGYVLLLQPAFLPASGSMEAHFAGWGHDAGGVFAHMISHPVEVMARMLGARDLAYVSLLLATLAFLPLLAPRWSLAALPAIAINVVSSFMAATNVESHYVTLALPGLFVGAAIAIAGLGRRGASEGSRLATRPMALGCAALLLGCLMGHIMHGATPISLRWNEGAYEMNDRERLLSWYARSISEHPEVSVMAPAAVIGHLAERRLIHSWAFDHPKPDVAILDIGKREWVQMDPSRWSEPMEKEIRRLDGDPAWGTWRNNPPLRVAWKGKPGGAARMAAASPGSIPAGAIPQPGGWPGTLDLVAMESGLSIESEPWSGRWAPRYTVRTVFYWKAERVLPAGLLIRIAIRGDSRTHVFWYLPTWGARDTGTWKTGEIIRDDQKGMSPGGWPLSALRATVLLVEADGTPYPPGAEPVPLAWE